MKKTLLLVVCLMTVGMQSVMAVTAQIVLRHQGNVKQFNPDELPSVIEAAVDGDTILLSAGTFDCGSEILIEKAITIIGAGAENTIIKNRIDINIPDNPTLTAHLLDGVRITPTLYIDNPVRGLKLRKCVLDGGISTIGGSTTIREMLIDRCKTGEIALSSRFMDMTVVNSDVQVYGSGYTPDAVVFSNCNVVMGYNSSTITASFINCYITNWTSSAGVNSDISFTNCLGPSDFWEKWSVATKNNCYTYTTVSTEMDNPEYFQQQGWLGTDGTIVGMYGGTTPFTLEPNAPKVTDYTIGVDTKTRMLNVKMTLSAN